MNIINKIFTQNPSDLTPVIRRKSFTRKWIYAFALTALSLPFPTTPHAPRSAGCEHNAVNSSMKLTSKLTASRAFIKGEKITITVATDASATTITTVSYNDNDRSEEHTSELQSHHDLVCRLLLEQKND